MRQVTIFFYGLFMSEDVLRQQGLSATHPRMAELPGFDIGIGRRASLYPKADASVWGVAYDLPPDEIARLYGEPSVRDYRPEAVLARTRSDEPFAALCYNLNPMPQDPPNPAYIADLLALAKQLKLPESYVARLARLGA
jgi:hypothetical protein